MNRQAIRDILIEIGRAPTDAPFDLLEVASRASGGEGVESFLETDDEGFLDLFQNPSSKNRAASAWLITHLYETGVIDWPLAIARAGLKVAA